MSGAVSILDLPEDCLGHVQRFLKLREISEMNKVCRTFRGLSSHAWNQAQTPTERLNAVNDAPNALVDWVFAGVGNAATCADDLITPALWRAKICRLLALSPPNPLRDDSMSAGAFWTPQKTIKACCWRGSLAGLAFLAARGVLDADSWYLAVSESLCARACDVVEYACVHCGLAPRVMHYIASSVESSKECYAKIAEYFPLPADARMLWFEAAVANNMPALQWLGASAEKLYEYCLTHGLLQRLFQTAATTAFSVTSPPSVALWLEPLFKLARESGNVPTTPFQGPFHNFVFTTLFSRLLEANDLPRARLLDEFFLDPSFSGSDEAGRCTMRACFSGMWAEPLEPVEPAEIAAETAAVMAASPCFEWFYQKYGKQCSRNVLRDVCHRFMSEICRRRHAAVVLERLERVFSDIIFDVMCSQDGIETLYGVSAYKTPPASLVAVYQHWRARAIARDPLAVFRREKSVLFSAAMPKTAAVISAALKDSPEEFQARISPGEFYFLVDQLAANVSVPSVMQFYASIPATVRAWFDRLDHIDCLESFDASRPVAAGDAHEAALRSIVSAGTVEAARLLLLVGNYGTPASWLRTLLKPPFGSLYRALTKIRRIPHSWSGSSSQTPEITAADQFQPLFLAAEAFLPEIVYVILVVANVDFHPQDRFPFDYLQAALQLHPDTLRRIMHVNPAFAAEVLGRFADKDVPSQRALADEAWTLCDPAALCNASMARLMVSQSGCRDTLLTKRFAQQLFAHGVSAFQLSQTGTVCGECSGFFASHGILVPEDVMSRYLAGRQFSEIMRRFVKLMCRLGYTGEQAAVSVTCYSDGLRRLFVPTISPLASLAQSAQSAQSTQSFGNVSSGSSIMPVFAGTGPLTFGSIMPSPAFGTAPRRPAFGTMLPAFAGNFPRPLTGLPPAAPNAPPTGHSASVIMGAMMPVVGTSTVVHQDVPAPVLNMIARAVDAGCTAAGWPRS